MSVKEAHQFLREFKNTNSLENKSEYFDVEELMNLAKQMGYSFSWEQFEECFRQDYQMRDAFLRTV